MLKNSIVWLRLFNEARGVSARLSSLQTSGPAMRVPLYPLRFNPVYEQRGAVGGLLAEYLKTDPARLLPPDVTASWEIADSEGIVSVVANGPLAGQRFSDLVAQSPREIVGRRHPQGRPFPLCVRIADFAEPEPLAVCPEDPVRLADETYRPNHRFWLSLAAGCVLTISLYLIMALVGRRIGLPI